MDLKLVYEFTMSCFKLSTLAFYRAGCANDTNTTQRIVCNLTNEQRIGVYGGLTGLVVVLCVGRNMLFFLLILRSSRLFHNKMFAAVLRAPVLFFDTNPVGR